MADVDSKKLIEHLEARWKNRPCPMCGEARWGIQNHAFELREYHGGSIVIGGGPIIPVIPVTCENCGNTVLVNGLLSGAITRPVEGDQKKGEAGHE